MTCRKQLLSLVVLVLIKIEISQPLTSPAKQRWHRRGTYLGVEVLALLGWVVLGVGGDVATTDFLDGDVLDVEANVVAGKSLGEGLVVHLHRLHLSGQLRGGEGDNDARLDNTSLNPTNRHRTNTSNFVKNISRPTSNFAKNISGRHCAKVLRTPCYRAISG